MLIYILLPIALAVPGIFLCTERAGKVGKAIYSVYFGVVIFLLAGFRSFVGTDYKSYAQLYQYFNFVEMDEVTKLAHEKGFAVPLKILCDGFESYHAMFMVIAFVIALGTAVFIYRFSSRPWVSAVAFVCYGLLFYSMNFMRQFIAGVIIMFAMEFIRDKCFFRYLALIMLASCFHWSALVMIPFYFILQIKLEPIVLAEYSVVSVMLLVFSNDIIELGFKTFYTKYLTDYTPDIGSGIPWFYLIGYGLLFAAAFALRKRLYKRDPMNSIYLSALFFVVLFELLGAKQAMLSRFGLLFILPVFLGLAPELADTAIEFAREKFPEKKRIAAVCTAVVMIIYSGGFFARLLSVGSNGSVPYRTVFEYTEDLW